MTTRTLDSLPSAASRIATRFGMPVKPTVILVRWPVVIICSYLLLYPSLRIPDPLLHGFILLYVASNVALYFVREDRFTRASFYVPLVLADTLILTLSLIVHGQVETDFYLTYFLLIIICCLFEDPKSIAVIAVTAPAIYTLLLFRSPEHFHPAVFLRLPFLLIVSLFYGYFTQLLRMEKALKEEAERRDQGKKEALDVIAHELRTPLSVISGYAQALRSQTFGPIGAGQEEALKKILRQSENLLYMVDGILDLARIEAGELTVDWSEIALPRYLSEIRDFHDVPPEKPVSLEWSIPADLPAVRSDRQKLTVILQNLINNAIKFTEAGTVSITARAAAGGRQVEIAVKDTGIGIPREAQRMIFEKFRQAENSVERRQGGIGLGLHVVKVYAGLIGAKIRVESEPNRGATFTLSLPVNDR